MSVLAVYMQLFVMRLLLCDRPCDRLLCDRHVYSAGCMYTCDRLSGAGVHKLSSQLLIILPILIISMLALPYTNIITNLYYAQ